MKLSDKMAGAALFFSLLALLLAWRANHLTSEGNKLSADANTVAVEAKDVAEKANEIAESANSPRLRITSYKLRDPGFEVDLLNTGGSDAVPRIVEFNVEGVKRVPEGARYFEVMSAGPLDVVSVRLSKVRAGLYRGELKTGISVASGTAAVLKVEGFRIGRQIVTGTITIKYGTRELTERVTLQPTFLPGGGRVVPEDPQ